MLETLPNWRNQLVKKILGLMDWNVVVVCSLGLATFFLYRKWEKKEEDDELQPLKKILIEFMKAWHEHKRQGNPYDNAFANSQWDLFKDLHPSERVQVVSALLATDVFLAISFGGSGMPAFCARRNSLSEIYYRFNVASSLTDEDAIPLSDQRKKEITKKIQNGKYDDYLSGKIKPKIIS